MFKTIVHHTVQDLENPEYVETQAPFKMLNRGMGTYLGEGYYFWDNHFDLACWWGEVHCDKKYMICKADFQMPTDDICDLVGSRKDQLFFQKCMEILKAKANTMESIITLLLKLEAQPQQRGIFPYKAIRAVDVSKGKYAEHLVNFNANKKGFVILNPKMIICLFKKAPGVLNNFKIIYPSKYED